jgi:hypothetical protein
MAYSNKLYFGPSRKTSFCDIRNTSVRRRGNPLQAAEHIDTPTSRQITHTEMRFKGPDHGEMAPLIRHPSMMSNLPADYEHFIGRVTDGFFADGELKLQRSEDYDVLNHPRLKTEVVLSCWKLRPQ